MRRLSERSIATPELSSTCTGRRPVPTRPDVGLRSGWLLAFGRFHGPDDVIREFRRAGLTTDITSQFVAITIDLFQCIANCESSLRFSNVTQHQQSGAKNSGRIGDVFPGNVGG